MTNLKFDKINLHQNRNKFKKSISYVHPDRFGVGFLQIRVRVMNIGTK